LSGRPTTFDPPFARLYLESRALEIIAETLSAPTGTGSATRGRGVPHADGLRRLHLVRDMLESECGKTFTVDGVAREGGMSGDALQSQFRTAFGTTVFAYLHECRLQRARRAIEAGSPVSQAAYAAGYNSPANFSTAFKRRFGCPPVLIGRRRTGELRGNTAGVLDGRQP
jgi:AraC-like DNA-binding protein